MKMTLRFLPLSIAFSAVLLVSACGKSEAPVELSETSEAIELPEETSEKPLVTIQKITDDVWLHTSSQTFPGSDKPIPSNGLAVRDGDNLVLVNTAWGELATVELAKKLKDLTGLEISKLVINHFHMDGLAGVDWLEAQGVEVFAHPDTPMLSAQRGTPVPDTSVPALSKIGARVKVGPLEILYPGPSHTQDHLMVYVTKPGILFGGCAVRPRNYKTPGNIVDADLTEWPKSLEWTKSTYPDTKMTIPSHGNPEAGLTLIDHSLAVLKKAQSEK